MTDEMTGGKQVVGRITFGPREDDNARPFDKKRAGLLDALEYAKTDSMTHVTIPTAALTELIAAAEECASDLACHVNTITTENDRRLYDSEQRRHETDMAPVRRLRAAVARVKGKAPMTMREKMARAMAEKDGKHWAPMSERFREAYYNHADAALSAMEEPTEAMVDAAWVAFQANGTAKDIFRAMIGAAKD